jgi:omega-6 fatty acid desaturase (delta-12 desaturase)
MTIAVADEKWRPELDMAPFATRHLARPIAFLVVEFALYVAAVAGAVLFTSIWAKLGCTLVAGALTSTLAIIGHDCAHRGGTRYNWLNRLIGTIGFLPALHPLSRWAYHHNQVHHRYTAQIGVDNAYPPMSVEQYRAASPAQQAKYRFSRSLWGQPMFYLTDIWARDIFAPRKAERATFAWSDWVDIALVYAWIPAMVGALAWLSHAYGATETWGGSFANAAVYGLIIPFLLWNLLISFVTVIQHTGPSVKWSIPTGRPSTTYQKMHGTVRIRFPEIFDLAFHRLMQHSAHHLNPIIPLYSLKKAQAHLEEGYGDDVISIRWTPSYHWQLTRDCKLYDPARDCWCDFNYQPTTSPGNP